MSTETKTEANSTTVDPSLKHKDEDSMEIVRRNSLWAMGVALVPVPGLDLLGVTGVQIKMLGELSRLYDVKFSEHRVKNILAALGGGLGALAGGPILFSVVKFIPIVGQTAGIVSLPLSAGAFTYAVGRVFIQHFVSGGTFLDFDPAKVREHFRKEYESAKQTVKDLQQSASPKA